ncbi:AAA family ATPase [Sphingomonas sp. MS122]|uniref:AAA family ATPase n=1 Tax=Sphingomonas sp. MS122 TaxID=3412683 RepID=UPI003C2DC8E3
MSADRALVVNDGGGFFSASPNFLDRLSGDALSGSDRRFLIERGHGLDNADALGETAYLYNVAERLTLAGPLDYLILVPTLRCNLSCSYCQVSRAALDQTGYDWSDATLKAVLGLIDGLPGPRIKIEFQGGATAERHGSIEITEIRRQREDWQRDATRYLATERTEEAISAYGRHDRIHAAETREDARAT